MHLFLLPPPSNADGYLIKLWLQRKLRSAYNRITSFRFPVSGREFPWHLFPAVYISILWRSRRRWDDDNKQNSFKTATTKIEYFRCVRKFYKNPSTYTTSHCALYMQYRHRQRPAAKLYIVRLIKCLFYSFTRSNKQIFSRLLTTPAM